MRRANAKPIVIAQAASGGRNHHLTPGRLTSIGSRPPRVSPCPFSPPVPAVYFSQSASQHQLPDARFPAATLRPRENRRGEKPHVKFVCKTRARNSTRETLCATAPHAKSRARNLLKKTRRKQKNFRQTRKTRLSKGWRLANYRPASCLSAGCLPVRWRPASCPPMSCQSVECRLANWRSADYRSAGRRPASSRPLATGLRTACLRFF